MLFLSPFYYLHGASFKYSFGFRICFALLLKLTGPFYIVLLQIMERANLISHHCAKNNPTLLLHGIACGWVIFIYGETPGTADIVTDVSDTSNLLILAKKKVMLELHDLFIVNTLCLIITNFAFKYTHRLKHEERTKENIL